MRWRTRGWRRGARPTRPVIMAVAVVAIGLCLHLLGMIWKLFQHAYVGSYWFVPGAQVNQVYWSSLRFAFTATVTVVAVAVALAFLLFLEVARGLPRR
jgi:ABC-type Fe3+ transport system permease subunit